MTPSQYAILLIVGAVVAGVACLYGVIYAVALAARPAAADGDDATLVDRARALRPPRTFFGRVDRGFEDAVRGTLFDTTTDRAVELLLLISAAAGLVAFVATENWLVALAAILAGAFVGLVVIAAFANRRRAKLQDQLPEGVFQLSRGLRSGLGLTSAVRETANYTAAPLSGVLAGVHSRLGMGMHPGEAFTRAAADVKLTDFDLVAAVVDLHTDVGGNLPVMLDRLAASIRDRNQYRGYFRSVTSLSRATLTFMAAAAPAALLMYVLLPTDDKMVAMFFASPLGWAIMAGAGILWLVGIVWSLWILRRADEY